MHIVHMTSVHFAQDTRIFVKMCRSLARAGHSVELIVPDKEPRRVEVRDGVRIHTVGRVRNRLGRALGTVRTVLRLAKSLKAQIYHFHDPEFLPYAARFQRIVKAPVIYDAHEDVRSQILYKKWLPNGLRRPTGWAFGWLEDRASRGLAGVVTATPSIAQRFEDHPHCVVVNNYPLTAEFCPTHSRSVGENRGRFAYLGVLSTVRSIREIVASLPIAGAGVRLCLAGIWESAALHTECRLHPGWRQVEELPYLDRSGVRRLLESVQAGLVLFHPHPNHNNSQPNKMFEYMAAGLPIIASDFPLWRSIIEATSCGLLVDPLDAAAIADAMRWIVEHPDEACSMGQRGRKAVLDRYNWDQELPKLLALYDQLTGRRADQARPMRIAC